MTKITLHHLFFSRNSANLLMIFFFLTSIFLLWELCFFRKVPQFKKSAQKSHFETEMTKFCSFTLFKKFKSCSYLCNLMFDVISLNQNVPFSMEKEHIYLKKKQNWICLWLAGLSTFLWILLHIVQVVNFNKIYFHHRFQDK